MHKSADSAKVINMEMESFSEFTPCPVAHRTEKVYGPQTLERTNKLCLAKPAGASADELKDLLHEFPEMRLTII